MKPRIRFLQKLWYCRSPEVTGLGYTAQMAYDDWLKLCINHWRKS